MSYEDIMLEIWNLQLLDNIINNMISIEVAYVDGMQ